MESTGGTKARFTKAHGLTDKSLIVVYSFNVIDSRILSIVNYIVG